MAKVRIHVLAKELDIQSKDILSFLAEKNINDKTASSSIEDETIAMVRNRFQKSKAGGKPESAAGQRPEGKPEPKAGGKAEPESKPEPKAGEKAGSEQKSEVKAAGKTEPESKPEPKAGEKAGSEPRPEPKAVGKPEQEPKTVGKTEPEAKPELKAAGKPEDRTKVKTEQRQEGKAELSRTEQTEPKIEGKAGTKTEERPKKKSSITAVFNPQNSKMGGRKSQGRGSRDRGARADGRRQAGASQGKRPAPQEQPQRTASERAEAVKAKFDKILGIERPAPAPKPERRPEQAAQEKSVEQMADNLSYMKGFTGLSDAERATLDKARAELARIPLIPCTACNYCAKVCPMGVGISGTFMAMNMLTLYGDLKKAQDEEAWLVGKHGHKRATSCIACGACEQACPQHIKIPDELARCVETLGIAE